MELLEVIKGKLYLRYIVKLDDGNIVEFSDNTRNSREKHWVICIPTQIGCPVGCFMCGSWQIPYKRSLTAKEMESLVKFAVSKQQLHPSESKLFAISFLGIGEPTFNAREVILAIDLFVKNWSFAKIIISSVGINNSKVIELLINSAKKHEIGFQFSLLGFTDEERRKSVKLQQSQLLTLEEMAEIGRRFHSLTQRKMYLDLLVKEEHQNQIDSGVVNLSKIFKPVSSFHISINVGAQLGNPPEFTPPASSLSEQWYKLLKANGFEVSYHRPLGVDNGCGIIARPKPN